MKCTVQQIGLLLLVALPAASQVVLTLPVALRRAGRTSLQADLARLDQAGAQEESAQVKSLFLPEVLFQGGHLNLDHEPALRIGPLAVGPIQAGPLTIGPLDLGTLTAPMADTASWRYKLSVQYLVYDFGKRERALAASRSKEGATGLKGSADVRKAQAEVAVRYVALLDVKSRKAVVAQRRKALEDHHRIALDLFNQGIVARNDLLRTEVVLRDLGDSLRALENAEAKAREALNVAMGLAPETPQAFPQELPPPPSLPWNEAACRVKAAEANEGVKALKAKVRALEEQLTLRKRDGTPNLVAEAAHSYAQNSYMVHPHENSLYVGLSWKIFDGARASKVRQSSLEADRGRREVLEGERQAASAAAASHREFLAALREADTAGENVKAAEENLRIVEDQYKEGLARTTDVLDAESVLAESRFSLTEKRYRAYTRQAALLAALGEDLPAFYETASATGLQREK